MHLVRVTEIQKNRETREIIFNTNNVEMITDELMAKIAIGLGDYERGLKEMRSVRCTMTSGHVVNLRFNGNAAELACMIHTRNFSHHSDVTKYIPNWTWRDDVTEIFETVLNVYEDEDSSSMDYDDYDRW